MFLDITASKSPFFSSCVHFFRKTPKIEKFIILKNAYAVHLKSTL